LTQHVNNKELNLIELLLSLREEVGGCAIEEYYEIWHVNG
jgi:hypothetical protein